MSPFHSFVIVVVVIDVVVVVVVVVVIVIVVVRLYSPNIVKAIISPNKVNPRRIIGCIRLSEAHEFSTLLSLLINEHVGTNDRYHKPKQYFHTSSYPLKMAFRSP